MTAGTQAVPRCQKCGGEIQGWTCQGCGQSFTESDAGALVFAPEPAGELREAAQAILDRWDSPLWKETVATSSVMNRLRAALAARGS